MTCGACNFAFSPQPSVPVWLQLLSHRPRCHISGECVVTLRAYRRLAAQGASAYSAPLPIRLASSLPSLVPKGSMIGLETTEMESGRWTGPGDGDLTR